MTVVINCWLVHNSSGPLPRELLDGLRSRFPRSTIVEGRIIDISYAAAQAIDLVKSGTARVHLQIMHNAANHDTLAIQAGSFRIYDNAVRLKEELEKLFTPVFITEFESTEGIFFRVLVGEFSNYVSAMEALQELKKARFDGFITRRHSPWE